MSRIALECRCGWHFFITETTDAPQVACPSCGDLVAIPGRGGRGFSGPRTPGQIAREKSAQQRTLMLLAFTGVAILVAAGALFFLWNRGDVEPRYDSSGITPDGTGTGVKDPKDVRKPERPPQPPLPPEPPRPPDFARLQTEMDQLSVNMDMAGICSEFFLRMNLKEDHERFQVRMDEYQKGIDDRLRTLEEANLKGRVDDHLQRGDRIVWFENKDFSTKKDHEVAHFLQNWLAFFRPGVIIQFQALRGKETLRLFCNFQGASPEIDQMIQAVAIAPRAAPPPGVTPGPADRVEIPAKLMDEINKRLAALPAGYHRLLPPDERSRFQSLLAAQGKVPPADVEFLDRRILLDFLPRCEQESRQIAARAAELERKAKELYPRDVVVLGNQQIEGMAVRNPAGGWKLRHPLGDRNFEDSEVKQVKVEKGRGAEFPGRLAAAEGKVAELAALAIWCKTKDMSLQKEYVYWLILTLDGASDAARNDLRLPKVFAAAPSSSATPPAPPAPPAPAAPEPAVQRIKEIAAEVVRGTDNFLVVVQQMKERTAGMVVAAAPAVPAKASQAVVLMGDPLKFNPQDIDPQKAFQLGNWWRSLTLDERREFAGYYGLWCAHARHLAGGGK